MEEEISRCRVIWIRTAIFAVVSTIGNSHDPPGRLISRASTTVVTQSSTFVDNGRFWSADKAIDGCFDKGCIARTMRQKQNWIHLNLQNVFKINAVVIHRVSAEHCSSCGSTNLDGIQVEMSKIETIPLCVYNHNMSDDGGVQIRIQSTDTDDPLPDSRYITIKRNNSLTVAEIQVFGDCADNYCGKECSKFCFCKTPLNSTEKILGLNCTDGCLDGWTGEKCDKRLCNDEDFGFYCKYKNNCLNKCNPWTGECLGADRSCKEGWSGPSCQKRHVNKPLHTDDERTVDNEIDSCVDTNTLPHTYLVFRQLTEISSVKILSKTVSDIEPTIKKIRPYSQQMDCKPQQAVHLFCGTLFQSEFVCDKTGIQILKLSNLTGSICEVKLYVCETGTFGPNCEGLCNCQNSLDCNSIDGTCPLKGLCQTGWHGRACDKVCKNNTYGRSCEGICHCLNDVQCHHETGKCPNGCEPGWEGNFCQKECTNNTYGAGCNATCHCIHDKPCNPKTGECLNGCSQGWTGDFCETMDGSTCPEGYYDTNCTRLCGHCARDKACDKETGHCYEGCQSGWISPECHLSCVNGSYGRSCSLSCGYCLDNHTCNHETGHCLVGCRSGWTGQLCQRTCPFGYYGYNCSSTCGHCAQKSGCQHETGECLEGCEIGWSGPFCATLQNENAHLFKDLIIPGSAVLVACIIVVIIITCIIWYRKRRNRLSTSTHFMGRQNMIYFQADRDGSTFIRQTDSRRNDYTEVQEAYESLMQSRSTILLENFQEIYKRLLSATRDGRTILFHTFQSLKSSDPAYQTMATKIRQSVNMANMSYQDLVYKYQTISRHGIGSLDKGTTHLLKFEGLSFIISDKPLATTSYWKTFETYGVNMCIQIGETDIEKEKKCKVGNISMKCKYLSEMFSSIERRLKVRFSETGPKMNITILSSCLWEDFQEIPNDLVWVIQTITYMEKSLNEVDCILVHCEHSINKAVLLSIMCGIFMKMNRSGLVDILGPTYAAWDLIPDSIGTYEQFKFLHDVVSLAIKRLKLQEN